MKYLFSLILFMSIASPLLAKAWDCDNRDKNVGVCKLPVWSGKHPGMPTRCDNPESFRYNCDNSTSGCRALPGGCFGDVPSGYWYALQVEEGGRSITKRCRCGCSVEETLFAQSGQDVISGTEIIQKQSALLTTYNALKKEFNPVTKIEGVVFGPESKQAYRITTSSGKKLEVSSSHPILTLDENNDVETVTAANQIKVGQKVLNKDGEMEDVEKIETFKYEGHMVNFNVEGPQGEDHFVVTNDLVTGDLIWQNIIASEKARLLERSDILEMLLK